MSLPVYTDPRSAGCRCDLCPLGPTSPFVNRKGREGQDWIPVLPEINPHTDTLVVGEAPGEQEENAGAPFVGKSGLEMKSGFERYGKKRKEFSYTNVALCRPPENDFEKLNYKVERENNKRKRAAKKAGWKESDPSTAHLAPTLVPTAAECCKPRLDRELAQYPNVIAMGGTAAKAVLMNPDASVMSLRGTLHRFVVDAAGKRYTIGIDEPAPPFAVLDQKVVPVLHPAFILRMMRWRGIFVRDVGRAIRWFSGALLYEKPTIRYNPGPETLEAFLYNPDNHFIAFDVETTFADAWQVPAALESEIVKEAEQYDEDTDGEAVNWEDVDDHGRVRKKKKKKDPKEKKALGLDPSRAKLRCIAFANTSMAMVVSFMSVDGHTKYYGPTEEAKIRALLKKWFVDKRYIKAGHNAGSYDRQVIEQHFGVRPDPLADTILMHRLADNELPHNLGFVASTLLDAPAWKLADHGLETKDDKELWLYCLHGETRIKLADGTTEQIQRIVSRKRRVDVLALDAGGRVVPARVTGWHRNRVPGQRWVCLRNEGTREHDRGLIVTPDHKVATPNGWRDAGELKRGDEMYIDEPAFTGDGERALLGTLLGDSILVAPPSKRKQGLFASPRLSLLGGHTTVSGLAARKVKALGEVARLGKVRPASVTRISGRRAVKKPFQPFTTRMLVQLRRLAPLIYDAHGKRRLTTAALDALGPIGLAWWFMDDGCLQKGQRKTRNTGVRGGKTHAPDTVVIATQGFYRHDVLRAKDWFAAKFGPTYVGADNALRLGRRATKRFVEAIRPYVFAEALYKLPRDMRPSCESASARAALTTRRPTTVRVTSARAWTPAFASKGDRRLAETRYCISVAGPRNFFTTHGLVHNCGLDACHTARLVFPLMEAVNARGQAPLLPVDHKIQSICVDMHKNGLLVDQKRRMEWEVEYVGEREKWLKRCRELAGRDDFNPGSVDQIKDLLFEKWRIPVHDYTDKGEPSTDDESMRWIITERGIKEEYKLFARAVRRYRKAVKILGTYIFPLRPAPFGIVWPDGRVRPSYNAHVVPSGRLSSGTPWNAQNVPPFLRDIIIAGPGHVLVGADADQIELRVVTALSRARAYLRVFEEIETGNFDPKADPRHRGDPHALTALMMFGDMFRNAPGSKDEKDSEYAKLRDQAKRICYASLYAAQPETVHEQIVRVENKKGELIYAGREPSETARLHRNWLDANPEFEQWWDIEVGRWRDRGYVSDALYDRRRDCKDGEDLSMIVNHVAQCTAASIMNDATIEIDESYPCECAGPNTGLIVQVHDQLVLEVPEAMGEKAAKDLTRMMTRRYDDKLPGMIFSAKAKVGPNWLDC